MTVETATLPDFAVNVTGEPAPQGSKRHVGNGRMIEANPKLPDWRTAVALQVRSAMKATPAFEGYGEHVPVRVVLTFRLRRPTSLPKITRRHARKPDLDKLIRATMDALTICGLLWDDGQVYRIEAVKTYVGPGEDTGCSIFTWQSSR